MSVHYLVKYLGYSPIDVKQQYSERGVRAVCAVAVYTVSQKRVNFETVYLEIIPIDFDEI